VPAECLNVRRCRAGGRGNQETYAGKFSSLLRLNGNAKRKEHGAKQNCGFWIAECGFQTDGETVDSKSFHCSLLNPKLVLNESEGSVL
jgi:hypothetical protein